MNSNELVEEISSKIYNVRLSKSDEAVRITAKEIISLITDNNGWVDVKDKLPITENDMKDLDYKVVDVNIYTKKGNVFPARFEAGNIVNFWSTFSGFHIENVALWQPLPSPPKQEGEA